MINKLVIFKALPLAFVLAACGGGGGGDNPPADMPELTVTKAVVDQSQTPAVEGTVIDYEITASNTGNIDLTNVVVSDSMLTPASATCATLAMGADCVLGGSYTVTAADVTAGEVQNTASADSNETNPVNSNTVTVNVPNTPSLSVSKVLTDQSDNPATEGTVLEYTVTATNDGNIALTSVVVSDSMLNPSSANCATLAIGADCVLTGTYTVTAADVTAGNVQNTAAADSSETSSVNSNTVTVSVGESSDSGLDVRPSNTTCIAPERPSSAAGYRLEQVFEGLGNLRSPLWMGQPPGDNSRWFVATRFRNEDNVGRIFSFANNPAVSATTTVLDVPITNPPNEGGLLGFAFAPDFATSGEAYVSYTRGVTGGVDLQSVVSRFTSADGGITLNPASEEEIIVVNQPFSNHNGGNIAFGPDGYLYFGLGDGGSISDPQNNAQTTSNVLGSMLRLDVSGDGTGYSIPPDNPFADKPICTLGYSPTSEPCPEIFAWGLRNPFRWSFDPATGDLWAGDVGNLLREEVSILEKGGNYGWVTKEGFVCLDPNNNNGILPSCDDAGLIDPIIDYNSGNAAGDLGRTVIGGIVYRGDQLTELQGKYVFGDSYSSNIWTLEDDGNGNVSLVDLIPNAGIFIAHFVEGIDGELYVVNLSGGIYEIVEDSSSGTNTIPDSLVDTGCVDTNDPTQPASGLI
ncbi:MAG: PQQ-dependent sugar dehydrogenase, partial [Gammaproteobacteria bacterium]|nr:PQQ-dependent sugar dehydrogenase [Gammaproteobacteria bacterium]